MLWGRSQSTHWSAPDARWLAGEVLSAVASKYGSQIWSNSKGIIDEREVGRQIQSDLEEKFEASPELFAAQFEVSKSVIYDIIKNMGLKDVYVGEHVVIPKPRVKELAANLKTMGSLVSRSFACDQLGVSFDVLNWLLQRDRDLIRINETLINVDEYESRRNAIHENLVNATSPIQIAPLEPNSDIRQAVLADDETPGSYDGSTGLWTPTRWVEARKKQCVEIFEKNGYISDQDLSDYGEKKSKFARNMKAVSLAGYLVSPDYLASQKKLINDALSEKGWFDKQTLELGPDIAENIDITCPAYRKYLVKPSFLASQRETLAGSLSQHAVEVAESQGKRWIPKASDLTIDPSIPQDLASILKELALPVVREECVASSKKILEAKEAEKARINDLKATVYLQGLLSVADENLKQLLWDEWLQYVAESGPVKSLSQAQVQYLGQFSPEEVEATAANMTAKVKSQLRAAKDPALILHLAIVLYHHAHYSPGLLKLRGRAIPLVLKTFNFPISFVELKNMIRHPARSLTEQVKKDVL